MAKRKHDLSMGGGIQAIDIRNPNTIEKDILTNTLDRQTTIKESPLNRLSGVKTEVTYFHQLLTDKNDYLVNINPMNTVDPNVTSYAKVSNFIIKMGVLGNDTEEMEGGGTKSFEGSGTIVILPNTIQPLPNDYFITDYRQALCLFRVTEVKPITMDKDTAYECEYELYQKEGFTYEDSELKDNVVTEYYFEQIYVGTKFRTIFRIDEYNALQSLKNMYTEISEIYYDYFYDKILGTYLLDFTGEVDAISSKHKKYATVTAEKGLTYPDYMKNIPEWEKPIIDDRFGNKAIYEEYGLIACPKSKHAGKLMYDGELIEFINHSRIFEYQGDLLVRPQQYINNKKDSVYNNTLFYAVEKQDSRRFKNAYMLPIQLDLASPSAQPVLFGKINLMHVSSKNEDCLALFPNIIYERVKSNEQLDFSPQDTTDNTTLVDRVANLVSLYINRKEKHILNHLLYLANDLDRFYNDIESPNIIFYLYPLLGYIIKEYVKRLAEKAYPGKLDYAVTKE